MIHKGPDLANILEICLTRMDAGSTIDELVDEFAGSSPEKAEELRALLQTVQAVQPTKESLRAPAAAQRKSRQRFLSEAQKLQQQPGASSLQVWLRFLRFLQHHAGSAAFAVTAILLLVIAFGSTRALPGDGLYPVKLVAEQASISLSGSAATREERESVYDSRRADEVAAMIQMKRTGAVSFGGYLSSTKDKGWQISGINLQLQSAMDQQAQTLNGVYVEITGYLGSSGEVQVEGLAPKLETVQGILTSMVSDRWLVGSQQVIVTTNTRVSGTPRVGSQVTVQAAHLANSTQILAISVEAPGEAKTSTPTATMTATAQPTITTAPTATSQPTINARPIPVNTPESQTGGGQTQPSQPSNGEPGDQHDNSTPNNSGGNPRAGDN